MNALSTALGRESDFQVDEDGNIVPRNAEEEVKLGWLRDLYASRLDIGEGIYSRLYTSPVDPFNLMEEQSENMLSIRRALNSESIESPFPQRLESYYDLVSFRGNADGKSSLEFYLGLPSALNTQKSPLEVGAIPAERAECRT